MAKRVVTRIGNIFSIEIDGEYKCYFQYIANDKTQLNSSVIRMFKKRYMLKENPSMDEIVRDDISFYAHTILKVGIERGIWSKVGTCKDIGDTENICFKLYDGSRWYGWKINHAFQYYDIYPDKFEKWDSGWVFSFLSILDRINKEEWTKW